MSTIKNIQHLVKGTLSVLFLSSLILTGCGPAKEPPAPAPLGDPAIPGSDIPANVTAAPGNQKATLNWDAVPGATSYNIYIATVGEINKSNFSALPNGMVHSTSTIPFTTHISLDNGVKHFFVVTATNGKDESGVSAEVSATPSDKIAVALALGENHSCVLIASGKVKCWGANYAGQLGRETFNSPSADNSKPVEVSGITTAVAITAGRYHTCALLADGTMQCWGEGKGGQLGNGITEPSFKPIPVNGIGGLVAAKTITAGEEFTCALIINGTMRCWGKNKDGQLGVGNTSDSLEPVEVSQIKKGLVIGAGYGHACSDTQPTITRQDQKVKCWGRNKSGQLGNGGLTDFTSPEEVRDFINFKDLKSNVVTALTAGKDHTCAILLDGSINCWGGSEFGQLGNGIIGSRLKSSIPVRISLNTKAISISSGESHTCAVTFDSKVHCWGRNHAGQLGTGTLTDAGVPLTINGFTARVVASGENHTCAIVVDGGVKCWGFNGFGQLGNGEFANADLPKDVAGVNGATSIETGKHHTCALITGNKVKCWGYNIHGQLGNATVINTSMQVDTTQMTTATAITLGGNHSCAQLSDGSMQCWGENKSGQIGNGGAVSVSSPEPVLNLIGVQKMAGGEDHTCAITLPASNKVWCWGSGEFGQVGNGQSGKSLKIIQPVESLGLTASTATSTVVDITAGGSHTCGILSDNTMSCWGLNESGQLGTGSPSTIPATIPQTVGGSLTLTNVKTASAGENHTCAVLNDGKIKCWGKNDFGQLGALGAANATPSLVSGIGTETVTTVTSGDTHTCVIVTTNGGEVRCWGDNEFGQLGTGTNLKSQTVTRILSLNNVTAVASGQSHTCAIINNDTVKCWGLNLYGQLGTGVAGLQSSPVAVLSIP
jgi:alpha-tubulin suppressor-like RCC1 family protein